MNNVPVHYIQQYTMNVALLLQQMGSKLRQYVNSQSFQGEQAVVVEQIGATNAVERTGRAQPLTPIDLPEDRRWIAPRTADWNTIVDNFDKLKMMIDPTSSFAQSGSIALGRYIDDRIIEAFFSDARTGKTGSTTAPFPTGSTVANAGQVVPVNFEAAANVGLTVAKLREAKRTLMRAEVNVDSDPLYCGYTAKQHDDLLTEAQAISLDYTTKPVMMDGRITTFMGFTFVHCERYLNDATPYRRIPVWAKSGMVLGIWQDIQSDVSQRKDLSSLPWQIYLSLMCNAVRNEEKKVVEIKCNEA